ncbi:ferric reductase-like transmembrane domain-containing protein [Candidatus Kaiserbacteria bacterium]|nr:ferric reductase-like transmembrane domain-containing protein [Candidatus Kaiserbacteria bacterium]
MKAFLKRNADGIAIAILAIIPIVIWLFIKPIGPRFASVPTTLRSAGQAAGLLGFALLSLNFVLSARLPFLDKIFTGLNKAYVKHHSVGVLAFSLILLHPLFLTLQYLFFSPAAAFAFLFSFTDTGVVLGELALASFIVLMVITLYLKFKYENWKATHKFLGVVLILGTIHVLLMPTDVTANIVLRYYLLALATAGGLAYAYRTVFSLYKAREYRYAVKEVRKVSADVAELVLAPLGRKMRFSPGQFVFLRFETGGTLSQSHPFSLTSSPNDAKLSMGVKKLGDFTSLLSDVKPGTTSRLEGPFGAFSFNKVPGKKQLWLAGGIGITPFVSMVRWIKQNMSILNGYEIELWYSVKTREEAAYAPEIEELARKESRFRFHVHASEERGRLSAHVVAGDKDVSDMEIFLCGPQGFMTALRTQFESLGVRRDRIHSEEFILR